MISSFWRPHYTTYMHITFLKLCENGNFSHSQSGNFHERCVGVCACPCVMMFTSALFTVRLFCVCKRSTRFWSRGLRALNCTFVVTRERKYAGYARVLLFGCQIFGSVHTQQVRKRTQHIPYSSLCSSRSLWYCFRVGSRIYILHQSISPRPSEPNTTTIRWPDTNRRNSKPSLSLKSSFFR